MNFQVTCDQVMLLETTAGLWTSQCKANKFTVFSIFDKSIFNTDLISNKFNKFFKSFKVPQSSSVISWQKKKCKTSPHRFSTECGIMFTSTTFLMTSTLQLKYRYLIRPRVTKNTTFKTYLQVYMYNVFIGHPGFLGSVFLRAHLYVILVF